MRRVPEVLVVPWAPIAREGRAFSRQGRNRAVRACGRLHPRLRPKAPAGKPVRILSPARCRPSRTKPRRRLGRPAAPAARTGRSSPGPGPSRTGQPRRPDREPWPGQRPLGQLAGRYLDDAEPSEVSSPGRWHWPASSPAALEPAAGGHSPTPRTPAHRRLRSLPGRGGRIARDRVGLRVCWSGARPPLGSGMRRSEFR
jgi:hypothetical protein